jgi:hypothetical protein
MLVPENPKIYHIVHWDRLASIIKDGHLLADVAISKYGKVGTTIGMSKIKQRRQTNPLSSHSGLKVGECVPFYFCPRSIMLYLIHKCNPELDFKGGQGTIVHLVADFHNAVEHATKQKLRWAFTNSNAGSSYFQDFCAREKLTEVDWVAIGKKDWKEVREGKQAEFLVEEKFSWNLIDSIAVYSNEVLDQVNAVLRNSTHKPQVEIKKSWYY